MRDGIYNIVANNINRDIFCSIKKISYICRAKSALLADILLMKVY